MTASGRADAGQRSGASVTSDDVRFAVIPARCRSFWTSYAATCAVDPTPRFLEAFHFDDNAPDADALGALVLAGTKRATAGLVWAYEHEAQAMPKAGNLSIVTTFAGDPLCIIETVRVDIVPFDAVDAEFAAVEGEGDGSLAYWRRVHEAFFGRECRRIGRDPAPDMPVMCERFEVVWRPPAASGGD